MILKYFVKKVRILIFYIPLQFYRRCPPPSSMAMIPSLVTSYLQLLEAKTGSPNRYYLCKFCSADSITLGLFAGLLKMPCDIYPGLQI